MIYDVTTRRDPCLKQRGTTASHHSGTDPYSWVGLSGAVPGRVRDHLLHCY